MSPSHLQLFQGNFIKRSNVKLEEKYFFAILLLTFFFFYRKLGKIILRKIIVRRERRYFERYLIIKSQFRNGRRSKYECRDRKK